LQFSVWDFCTKLPPREPLLPISHGYSSTSTAIAVV
jgi:hypothetical protein